MVPVELPTFLTTAACAPQVIPATLVGFCFMYSVTLQLTFSIPFHLLFIINASLYQQTPFHIFLKCNSLVKNQLYLLYKAAVLTHSERKMKNICFNNQKNKSWCHIFIIIETNMKRILYIQYKKLTKLRMTRNEIYKFISIFNLLH